MTWLHYAIATAVSYAVFDLLIKLVSDKVNGGVVAFLSNLVAAGVALIFILYSQSQGEKVWDMKPGGLMYVILAGIAIGLVSVFFVKVFALGTNLSVGIPLIRVGAVLGASLLGIIFLKEGVSTQYLVGAVLSLVGLYLLVS